MQTPNPSWPFLTLLILLGSLALSRMVGCSEKFQTCEQVHSCEGVGAGAAGAPMAVAGGPGVGGQNEPVAAGGESAVSAGGMAPTSTSGGSEGGSAGAPPQQVPECQTDADCADPSFCNGVERCRAGLCESGEEACPNDAAHCLVVCNEVSESCDVSALDADADGFGSAECVAAPGDDCRDDDAAIHPAALELCDGIDNDCNGRIDTADGLPLAGATHVISDAVDAALAWSPVNEAFGILYARDDPFAPTNQSMPVAVYGTLTASGAIEQHWVWERYPLDDVLTPLISWGEDSFALSFTWMGNTGAGQHGMFFRAAPHKDPGYAEVGNAVLDIAYRGNQEWLRPLRTYSGIQIDSVRDDLVDTATVEGAVIERELAHMRIAIQGRESATVWQPADSREIEWVRWNEALEPGEVELLANNGVAPDITAVASGYLIAWATAEGVRLLVKDAEDGATVCGPVTLEFGDGLLSNSDAVSLASDEQFAWLLASKATRLELFRLDHECELSDRVAVTESAQTARAPKIALGGGRVALTWNEKAIPVTGLELQARTRQFTEALCE